MLLVLSFRGVLMESFCHVGGRQGSHPQYGQNCVVYPGAQNCAFCGKDWSQDATGPVAKPTKPKLSK